MVVRPSNSNTAVQAASKNVRPLNVPDTLPPNTEAGASLEGTRPLAYTIPQAAKAICCSKSFLWGLINQGQGPKTFHVKKKHLILAEELHRWLKEQAGC